MKKDNIKNEHTENKDLSISNTSYKYNAVALNKRDNVAVALCELKIGDTAYFNVEGDDCSIVIKQDVPVYHKFSSCCIDKNSTVFKYGQPIGKATIDIEPGQHVHSHNLISVREYIES